MVTSSGSSEKPATPLERRVNLERLPLALWDYGGEGPRVLFVHGFLDSGRGFEDVARDLAGECRCLCLDWRGHGASSFASADAASHQLDHLKDLVCVLEELVAAGEGVDLIVAHSMGGTISLMLAGFAPEMVPRLLLLDCVGGYAADAKTQVDQMSKVVEHLRAPQRGFRTFESRAQAESRVRQNNPGLSEAGSERIVRHYLDALPDGGYSVRLDPNLRGPNPYRFPEEHWMEICRRVTAPTCVVAPEEGYMFRIPELQQRLAAIPHCRRVDVPGVGHHVQVERPELVAAEVRKQLLEPR
ncbi:MAG: alpha/beta fold hydrolase [Planctomycetota bacterium]